MADCIAWEWNHFKPVNQIEFGIFSHRTGRQLAVKQNKYRSQKLCFAKENRFFVIFCSEKREREETKRVLCMAETREPSNKWFRHCALLQNDVHRIFYGFGVTLCLANTQSQCCGSSVCEIWHHFHTVLRPIHTTIGVNKHFSTCREKTISIIILCKRSNWTPAVV